VISVAVAINAARRLAADPEIRLQGIPVEEDREAFIREAEEVIEEAVNQGEANDDKLREALRLAVRRCATQWTGKKPVVDIMLLQVG
jgi:ribonuclease J